MADPQKPLPTPQKSSYGSSLLGALGSGFSSAVGALPSLGIGAAANGLFNMIGQRMQYKYNKKLMALQNQYSIEAFNRENDRQDWLLRNSAALQKQGLENAGYSTADPSGTGFEQPTTNNQDVPSNPSAQPFDMSKFGLAEALQARLVAAQAENLEIKNRYEVRRQEGEIGALELDLKKYRETIDEQVGEIKSRYYNVTKQNRRLDAEIDNLAEVTKGIHLDNNFKESSLKNRLSELSTELEKLGYERDIKKAEKLLADNGILLGNSDLGTFFSLATCGKTPELMDAVKSMTSAVMEGLPSMVKDLIKAFFDGCVSAAKEIFE